MSGSCGKRTPRTLTLVALTAAWRFVWRVGKTSRWAAWRPLILHWMQKRKRTENGQTGRVTAAERDPMAPSVPSSLQRSASRSNATWSVAGIPHGNDDSRIAANCLRSPMGDSPSRSPCNPPPPKIPILARLSCRQASGSTERCCPVGINSLIQATNCCLDCSQTACIVREVCTSSEPRMTCCVLPRMLNSGRRSKPATTRELLPRWLLNACIACEVSTSRKPRRTSCASAHMVNP